MGQGEKGVRVRLQKYKYGMMGYGVGLWGKVCENKIINVSARG